MEYNVIIVGAGSAGCVVAGKILSETSQKVLLLEAGSKDHDPMIHMPAGYSKILANNLHIWDYHTVGQKQLDGKTRRYQAGRVVGGGSSINGLCYVRGQRRDYDGWEKAAGGTGAWGYDDMLHHFISQEANDTIVDEFHGNDGKLHVSMPAGINDLNLHCLRAFQQYGLPYNPDYNGKSQRGVSPVQATIGGKLRCSSAEAFLRPVEDSENLDLKTGVLVESVIIENGRAVGVRYRHHKKTVEARADEVILCAGTMQTPKILMLSGIGPAEELKKHGIEVVVDSPNVGKGLQDHAIISVKAHCKKGLGYQSDAQGLGMMRAGILYVLDKEGPAASNGVETVSYFNPEDIAKEPTIQCYHVPIISEDGLSVSGHKPGITFELVVLQPKSRGSITLKDKDPESFPLIDPNWMSDPHDVKTAIASVRMMREVMKQPALAEVLEEEVAPGPKATSDADLTKFIHEVATTMWHPVGSCAMGHSKDAVVDPELRVNGVKNLRVIDASIMPNIVSANTNAPTMALADKGVDLYLGRKSHPHKATAHKAAAHSRH